MAYTAGVKTIGLPASDYLTVDAAIADYAGGGLTGDLTFMIEADTTWNNNFNIHALNGFTFLITCSDANYHRGNTNQGLLITLGAVAIKIQTTHNSPSYKIIEKVKFNLGRLDFYGISNLGNSTTQGHIVRNCIFDDTNLSIEQTLFTVLNVQQIVYNNLFIYSHVYYDYTNSVYVYAPGNEGIFLQNTFYGGAFNWPIEIRGGAGLISTCYAAFTNNVYVGDNVNGGFAFINSGAVLPYAFNNFSENDTAPNPNGGNWRDGSYGNKTGVSDDDFKSVVLGNDDFLSLNQWPGIEYVPQNPEVGEEIQFEAVIIGSSILFQAGVTSIPVWADQDIALNQRPDQGGKVSVGAFDREEIIASDWDFDDGMTSDQLDPEVTYTSPGAKEVVLVVTYIDGATETVTVTITLSLKDINFLGVPRTGVAPLKVKFNTIFD